MNQNIKIALRLLKINILNGLMYRGDFWAGTITELFYLGMQVLFIAFIFQASGITEIAGFSLYEVYFVWAEFELLSSLSFIFVSPSAGRLFSMIHYGDLDKALLKPRMLTFVLFNNSWVTDSFSGYVFNGLLLVYIWPYLSLSGLDWWRIIFILVTSFVIYSMLQWLTTLVNFYSARFDALNRLVRESYEILKYPRKIYPKILQNFYLFFLPLFLIANPIYEVMAGTFDWDDVLVILAMTVLLVGLTWFMWVDGLRRYVSAS